MTEQVVKSKDLRRQTKEWMAVFHQLCEKIIEKAVSICVIIPQNRKVKKNSTSHYPSEFRAQQYGDKLTKKTVGKP